MPRVYVAGPMTGLPGLNFPAFHGAAATLRAQGFEVENPAEINADHTMPWAECMRRDIAALLTCTHIYMLKGWTASKGARLERHIAAEMGLEVLAQEGAGIDAGLLVTDGLTATHITGGTILADVARQIQQAADDASQTAGQAALDSFRADARMCHNLPGYFSSAAQADQTHGPATGNYSDPV